ncbi:MAG: response regulator [Verrucomicrobiota bacterium]
MTTTEETMIPTAPDACFRILVIDDNAAIHEDFRKILTRGITTTGTNLAGAEAALFGETTAPESAAFEIDSAYQGKEGLELVRLALAQGRPYALAFVDVRMPPGWDGVETIGHIWRTCPELQVVICTAYSDYPWNAIVRQLGTSANFVILKKPFDNVEVLQLAHALTKKWLLAQKVRGRLEDLDLMVQQCTRYLQEANEKLRLEIGERERKGVAPVRRAVLQGLSGQPHSHGHPDIG